MKKPLLLIAVICLSSLATFTIGYFSGNSRQAQTTSGRKILHYIDPMHPSYKSDRPGIAPDCGMQLEPVYADGTTGGGSTAGFPPGSVEIDTTRQQLLGVRVAPAETGGGTHTLRLVGRVVPDERNLYVINATVDGWITGVRPNTTGSIVRKDEVLGSFYSPDFLSAVQALLFALTSADRAKETADGGEGRTDQLTQFAINLRQYRDSLRNLGMGNRQIDELVLTRKYRDSVDITSPANGIILSRAIAGGQRFERGKELYRIADLSRVWILVDAFDSDARHLKPGMSIRVSVPSAGKTVTARVSPVPPQFDPASRTLKVRLEADNPGYQLRPDMLATAELPVTLPDMLSIPADAVMDTGTKKTVFVEARPGLFEPRLVETGRQAGDRVEIVAGIRTGERVAVSGTFLLDSESRMKLAAAGISTTPRRDPVCGMYVDEERSRAAKLIVRQADITEYFCSAPCRDRYLKTIGTAPAEARPAPETWSSDPVCGMKVDEAAAEKAGRTIAVNGRNWSFCSAACREEFRKHPDAYGNGADGDGDRNRR